MSWDPPEHNLLWVPRECNLNLTLILTESTYYPMSRNRAQTLIHSTTIFVVFNSLLFFGRPIGRVGRKSKAFIYFGPSPSNNLCVLWILFNQRINFRRYFKQNPPFFNIVNRAFFSYNIDIHEVFLQGLSFVPQRHSSLHSTSLPLYGHPRLLMSFLFLQ